MSKKILVSAVLLCSGAAVALAYFVWPFIRGPEFTVTNATDAPVTVEAEWWVHTRQLGELAPNESVTFQVDDREAGMIFIVSFPDGAQVRSDEVYFASSSTVEAFVTNAGINVNARLGM